MNTNQRNEAHDLEAMRALGKPYSECNTEERDAVELAVSAHRLVDAMNASGAKTIGEFVQARRNSEANG